MPLLGMEAFDPEIHNWSRYEKRLKNFLLATKVEDGLILPTIFTLLGDKTFGTVCDLFYPDNPDSKSPQEVLDKLSSHFSPKTLVPVERFRFAERKQKENESTAEFLVALRNLSKNCQYNSSLEDRLCEQFIFGLRDEDIRTRLLIEESLPLEVAVRISSGLELAKKGATTFNLTSNSTEVVHHVKRNEKPSVRSYKQPKTSKSCKHCGGNSHEAEVCRYKDFACNLCKKIGHLAKICRSSRYKSPFKKGNGGFQVKNVKRDAEIIEDDVTVYDFHRINIKRKIHSLDRPIIVQFLVNNQPINFELDTGAGVTLISKKLYLQSFTHCDLIPTTVHLNTISEQIKPLGKIVVSAKYNDIEINSLEIYVLNELQFPLLGRTWISQFGILDSFLQKNIKHIEVEQSSQLDNMLKKYSKLFSSELGELKDFEAHLTIKKDSTPRFFKYRPIPFALRTTIELELQKLQDQGILAPIQHSEWAAPIVPILKKNNSIRICGDYKVGLNPALLSDSYPLPRIEDIFTQLNGGVIFTKLDMTQAYQQLKMDETSQMLLTINTHKGLFKMRRMPFGISPAPSIFQRIMDQILAGLSGVVCYLDDILITGRSISEHLFNLDRVLNKLSDAGITLNKKKCEFLKPRVEYLGHVIDAQGLHATDSKISGITEAPIPKDVAQLRSFLGLVSYYRKFLPDLASNLAPLNKLLHKDITWNWDHSTQGAFDKVKKAITSPKVLTYLNPKLPISLACDASPSGLGAVISHIYSDGTDRPIAFASRSLTTAERNYSQLDKEALGIIFGVKKFHQYLFGRKFILLTDHKPLTRIFAPDTQIPSLAASRLQRWSLILSAYDYQIKYRKSADHLNADALSRSPNPSINYFSTEEQPQDLFMINHIEGLPVTSKVIAQHSVTDATLSKVIFYTKDGWPNHCTDKQLTPFYTRKCELNLLNDCLLWGLRVIIPIDLQKAILAELHKDHVGIVKMKMLARSYFWWPNLNQDIEELGKACPECTQHTNNPAKTLVHPWIWPSKPWERIHLDFAGPFMGHNFLIAVDAHSKWPEVAIMSSTTTEKTITVLQALLARYGLPQHIVTDNGTQFTSTEFDQFCQTYGIKHSFSAPYHPATNGQAERFVQTLKRTLKKKANDNSTLTEKLNQLLLSYRSTPHIATHQTPAKLFLGREIRIRLDLLRPAVETTVHKYQDKMSPNRDNKQVRKFATGQNVLARNYLGSEKWTPAIIRNIIGPVTYTIELPNGKTSKRHIDQLREHHIKNYRKEKRRTNTIPLTAIFAPTTPPQPTLQGAIKKNILIPTQPRRNPTRIRRPPNRLSWS